MSDDFTFRKGKLSKFFFFSSNSVSYRLSMAFGLFFFCPLLTLLFLGLRTDILGSDELLYSVIGVLFSTLFGYAILCQISDNIARVEKRMTQKMDHLIQIGNISGDEISNISMLADIMNDKMEHTSASLERRINEIHALNELSSISLADIGMRSLVNIALKRVLTLETASDGAILLVKVKEKKGTCLEIIGDFDDLSINKPFNVADFPCNSAMLFKGPLRFSSVRRDESSDKGYTWCLTLIDVLHGNSIYALIKEPGSGFSDEMSVNFIDVYFSAVGNKLRMAEIERREQRTSKELNIMYSIINILNSVSDEQQMFTNIARKIDTVLPHKWVGLVQKNIETGSLYLSHSFSDKGDAVETGDIIKEKNSLIKMAVHSDGPLLFTDSGTGNSYERFLCSQMQLGSILFARLNNNGRNVGVVCIGREKDSSFSVRDKRLFTLVANGFSVAFEHARAVFRERTKQVEVELLSRVEGAISSRSVKTEKILSFVLKKVTELVDVEAGNIMMMEFDSLRVAAVHGNLHKNLVNQRFKLGSSVAGYVVSAGDSVTIEDANDYPAFKFAIDKKAGFETETVLCVPMISGGRVVGVIELLNRKQHPFSDEDVQAVKAIAASVSIVLENIRLYEESHYIAEKEHHIRSIFQRYVPEKVVTDVLQNNEKTWMAVGQKRTVTIFNVDIRGYSKLSKQASTEDVVHVLNYFFTQMGHIVLTHRGIVDKYLGDGLLAIFGAPVISSNSALDAVLAAQEMVAAVDKVSAYSLERCGVPLAIGISINTGEAIVGNIGFSQKMEYTVIGDVVNETFRIQELTREKRNMILVGKSTYRQVKSHIKTMYYGLKKFDASLVEVYEIATEKNREQYQNIIPLRR